MNLQPHQLGDASSWHFNKASESASVDLQPHLFIFSISRMGDCDYL